MTNDKFFDKEGLITKYKKEQSVAIPAEGTLMTPTADIYMWDAAGKAVMCKDRCSVSTIWIYLSSKDIKNSTWHAPQVVVWCKFLSSAGNIGWTSRIDLMKIAT